MPYFGVFAVSFLEAVAIIGLLVPGTTAVAAAGAAAQTGKLSYWGVLVAAAAGAFVGDGLSYLLGGRLHRVSFLQPWFARHASAMASAERFVQRWGAFAVILGRFLAPTRAFVPLIAGTGGMPALKFWLANVVGASAWAFFAIAIGEGAMNAYERVPSQWTLVAVAVLVVAWLLWVWKRRVNAKKNQVEQGPPRVSGTKL